jgi:hypothetical protein
MSNEKRKREDELDDPRPQRDENNNNGGDNMPRFSFTWIYVLIGLALLGPPACPRCLWNHPPSPGRISKRMVRAGDIEKLEVVNKETARAYIKKDSLVQVFRSVSHRR